VEAQVERILVATHSKPIGVTELAQSLGIADGNLVLHLCLLAKMGLLEFADSTMGVGS
jgi:predicted ArsR family transcriptional regulator